MLVICGSRVGLIISLCLISYVVGINQYGTPGRTLYVEPDSTNINNPVIVNKQQLQSENENVLSERRKRDIPVTPALQKNISTWTTHLNDSHQQLMVHWVGEGSNVIICLARDSIPRSKGGISPSALFISYDYGKNFTNKTESFKLADTPNSGYAQLDKFFNHPKYPEFCVFVDTTNKKLYYTSDNGRNIHRSDLTFQPSELAFDEELPDKFVVLDKVDPNRPLFLTLDGGKTFKQIHALVKTFFWSSGEEFPKAFYVERWEPNGTSTVLVTGDPVNLSSAKILFKDAKDFQIKGDYMFATKQSKERNTLDLYISHQRKPFYKAEFETELDLRKFHVADVTDKRIFVSVMHTESLADLYVSEISNNFTQYRFVVSLEQILCYFPDGNWKNTWLEDATEDPFTDLYRVEGLKGIYIASRIESKALLSDIGPEHVISLITYDHGATWSHINAPAEDENGKPLSCHIENSCSLHLCQKFSQLYPVTSPPGNVVSNDLRSANIMSSKSAPGIIMATGVMGKSLKGIPGVYLSRDAGITWRKILKDYYFFNYGDHGGVLVAVKYFKARGETRNILYSTNEGIEWNSYQFNADDLRMYGLMTEPGENTTTFTMFGSANDQHQWIIITIDLKNAFDRNCTTEDYKFWSPSPPNMSVSCVLGQRDVFQRRLAHANCHNGIDYQRFVKKEVCECSRRDFECDFGFKSFGDECIRNKSAKYDPYTIPSDCRPGHFYKRTKGYRKIDGDVCTISSYLSYLPDYIPCPLEEPTEFILVALRDRIARIDLSDNSTVYPVKDQNNIVAIEFDMKNNCIYWADIELDKISRQCLNGGVQEVIVDTDLASIEGMALDWISNVLFFVDGIRKKIEAVRTDLSNEGRMRVTILDNKVLSKPRGIAVHPKAGYLFWTDWDRNSPSVSRSNLDGSNVKELFGKRIVKWPNGITIDQMSERIYWVDAMEDYIASADLNGRYFRRIVWNDDKVSHPFAVAVLKDKVIWDDWKMKAIFIADKDSGANLITINNNSFSGLMMMDLKVFAHFVQYGSNACSYKNTSCDTMCLGGPGNTFSCLCPDGFIKSEGKCVCQNGMQPAANMTCPKKEGTSCGPDQFTCKNGLCISSMWRCDGNNDCGDLSDEIRCPICSPPMISCNDDTRCYLPHWKCDGDVDCPDMSDEKDCAQQNCTESQFQCANGQCIDKKWLCDGDNDCKDGSDERNCSIHAKRTDTQVSCTGNSFPCGNDTNAICIPNSWVCDGERDCAGGEDESPERCKDSTCAPYMFRCPGGKCIFKSWVCDGENDCGDKESSDEKNCTRTGRSKLLPRPNTDSMVNFRSTCLDWMFKCDNGNCVPYWWRCDSVDDCGDNSDELGCAVTETTSLRPIHDVTRQKCGKNRFSCSPGTCIPLDWVCDMAVDCPDGSDEVGCARRGSGSTTGEPCAADETPCADGHGCVPDTQLCDGIAQCADKSDEAHCTFAGHDLEQICPAGYTLCDDGIRCIIDGKICDGHLDCFDGTDEANCTNDDRTINKFLILGVDQASINSTSFVILCWKSQVKSVQYSFLPSISKVSTGVWKNLSWTDDTIYRFTDLEPYTNYNVTLYVRDSKSNKTYASMKYMNTTTGQGVPSPPVRLTIRQQVGSHVVALWDPPKEPRGIIRSYTLKYAPPLPPMSRTLHVNNNKATYTLDVDGYFKPNVNYSFWVVATNDAFTSEPSQIMNITFDEMNDVDDLVNVSMSRKNGSVFLKWHKIHSVEGYKISIRTPPGYPKLDDITTKGDNITLTNLPHGVELYIDVMAYKDGVTGKPFTIPIRTEGTPEELPSKVVGMLLKEKGTSVQLSWSPPSSDRYKNKELEYEIHYVNVINYHGLGQYSNDTKIRTRNNSLVVDNLHACEAYVFSVGLVGGPAKVLEIITRENERAPVKNLHFSYNEPKSRLHILWNANCDVIRNPVTYILEITEETRNKTSLFELKPTKNISCSHIIEKLPAGGRYSVCVYSTVDGSMRACSQVRAREIAPPENVAAYRSQRGHVMVSWRHDDDDKHDQKYEVIVSDKEIPDDLLHPTDDMKVVTAKTSPMLVLLPEFQDATLYVAVRTLTEDGYYSGITEVHTLEMGALDDEEETSSAGALWWGCGAALVAGVVLAAALVHLALKHRRLARSFLRFTAHTPRYDSRRGQATIADHDEDDVPPIQGFSDDEPLVIA